MKKLIVALLSMLAFSCHPLPAGADQASAVEKFTRDLMDGAKANGIEPGDCVVKVEDENEDLYALSAQCSNMRYMCLFAVRKTDGAAAAVGCQPNPEFKESQRIDSRTEL